MRKLSLALMASLCFMGISSAAGASSVSMVWTGQSGGVILSGNSATLSPSSVATLTLDMVITTETGCGGLPTLGCDVGAWFVNFVFDTDLGNELNYLKSEELSWSNMAGNRAMMPISPGINSSFESTGAAKGNIFQFDGVTLGTGPTSTTLTFARLVFSTNLGKVTSDGNDVFVDGPPTLFGDSAGNVAILSYDGASVNVVPEPGTVSLLVLSVGGLLLAGRRGRK